MYSILGVASLNQARERFAQACDWIAGTERGLVNRQQPESDQIFWGTTGEGGAVLGVARSDRHALAYLGSFCHPFPGLTDGSPLDDPSTTAKKLLTRFDVMGPSFLDGLHGNYALIVADAIAHRILIARGPSSSPRVFLKHFEGGIEFSTKLLDFRGFEGDKLRLDRSLEDFLLGYEFLPDGRTLYADVKVLDTGTILDWHSGSLSIHQIAKPTSVTANKGTERIADLDQAVAALHTGFRIAMDSITPSEKKVAVMLGGFDSALIAAELSRMGKNVETFSFSYEEPGYNQALTDDLANFLGIKHNWVPITPEVLREGLANFSARNNQIVGQAHYLIATIQVAKAVRERGFRHCLTGDGCDGLFLGYPTVHFRAKLIHRLSSLGPFLQSPLAWATRSAWLERKLGHPYRIARNVATILGRPMPVRGHIAACTLDRISLRELRGEPPPQEMDTEDILHQLAKGLEHVDPMRLAYMGKGRVGLNTAKLEGASSYSGVVLNSPYLHQSMVEVAQRIPDTLNRPQEGGAASATGKYAFMRMVEVHQLLPAKYIHQKKMSPVTAPVDYWLWHPLHDFVMDELNKLPFPVNRDFAESLVTPKMAERVFRERIGISRFVTPAISLLATYASFTQYASPPSHQFTDKPC